MDNKIDIHTHILPGVDDGSKSIDESIEIINYLSEQGITEFVLTSHYIKDSNYNKNVKTRTKILKDLTKKLNNKNIKLYLGNEVYICDEVIDLLNKQEIATLNNTKYMLIELPLTNYIRNLQNILCELNDNKIVPIIAHPERYKFLQKDKKRIKELLQYNCLLQCNIDSLVDKYGKSARKVMKWLLKNDLVSFVATDTHYVGDSKKLEKAYKKLKKLVKEDKYNELVYLNPKKMLRNEEVSNNLDYLIKEEKY